MLCFFSGNVFVVAAAVVFEVAVNFECVDFVALAAGIDDAAVHASFVYFVPAVAEIVVVVHDTNVR